MTSSSPISCVELCKDSARRGPGVRALPADAAGGAPCTLFPGGGPDQWPHTPQTQNETGGQPEKGTHIRATPPALPARIWVWTRRAPLNNLLLPRVPPKTSTAAGHLTGGMWRQRGEQPVGVTLLQAGGRLGPHSPPARHPGGRAALPPPLLRVACPRPQQTPQESRSSPPSPGASITGLGRCGASWRPLPSRSAHSWPRAFLGNRGVPSSLSACARGRGEEEDSADVQAAGRGSAGPTAMGLAGPGRGVSRLQPGPRQKGRALFSEAVAPSRCHRARTRPLSHGAALSPPALSRGG